MAKQLHRVPELPTALPKVFAIEPPLHTEGHDEWLLDEALAETFPVSDSIAVSPYSRPSD